MAGKLCYGAANDFHGFHPKLSHAYCEGRDVAAAEGDSEDNPHPADTEAYAAWDAGFDSWTADPDGVPRDCCATAYGGGYEA